MPERNIAAKRYAEAVFGIAREHDTFDQWLRDLQSVAGVFGDEQAFGLLGNARVPESAKTDLLRRTLAGVSPEAMNFARLLVQRGRVGLAPGVVTYFREMVDNFRNVAHADVTTAVPVSAEEKRFIEARLSELMHKTVTADTRVDPRIIGGVIARVGDRLIDGSTRTRLIALWHRLEAAR